MYKRQILGIYTSVLLIYNKLIACCHCVICSTLTARAVKKLSVAAISVSNSVKYTLNTASNSDSRNYAIIIIDIKVTAKAVTLARAVIIVIISIIRLYRLRIFSFLSYNTDSISLCCTVLCCDYYVDCIITN